MNTMQKIAITTPCFDARQCAERRYGRRLRPPNDDVSAILTFNVGLE